MDKEKEKKIDKHLKWLKIKGAVTGIVVMLTAILSGALFRPGTMPESIIWVWAVIFIPLIIWVWFSMIPLYDLMLPEKKE